MYMPNSDRRRDVNAPVGPSTVVTSSHYSCSTSRPIPLCIKLWTGWLDHESESRQATLLNFTLPSQLDSIR